MLSAHLSTCVCVCVYIHAAALSDVIVASCSSGLWPDGSDGTDINAVCRSNDKSLLVTGDDFGKVHLFSYPCSQFRVRRCTNEKNSRICMSIFASYRIRVSSYHMSAHSLWKSEAIIKLIISFPLQIFCINNCRIYSLQKISVI